MGAWCSPGESAREVNVRGWEGSMAAGSWERVGLGRLGTEGPGQGADAAAERAGRSVRQARTPRASVSSQEAARLSACRGVGVRVAFSSMP